MQIIWSTEAEADLEEAFEHISAENPQAALKLFYRVKEKVELLVDHPGLGKPGRVPGTKELVITNTPFVVPYRVLPQKKQLQIIRVFHSSREWPEEI